VSLRRPSILGILLSVSLLIALLPLGGIAVLRLYESVLVRQTETALIAQGAFVAAAYRAALARISPETLSDPDYGRPAERQWLPDPGERWHPRPAVLHLATSPVLAKPSDAAVGPAPDAIAREVGQALDPVIRDAQSLTLAAMRIVDYKGVVVASTGGELNESLIRREEVHRALRGEPVSVLRERISDKPTPALGSISRGAGVRVFVSLPVLVEDRVVAALLFSRTPRTIAQALYGHRQLLALSAIIVAAVALGVAAITAYTIARPIRQVIAQARRAIAGERRAMVPLTRPVTRDVDALSRSVSEMATRLEQRAEYLRTFADHVSHEFKAPLTGIRGSVELLRDHLAGMSESERDHFLSNLDDDASRLQRLVNELLALARADLNTAREGRANVAEALEEVASRFHGRGVAVKTGVDGGAAEVAMEKETLVSVLSSLLDNARIHGGDNVAISATHGLSQVVIKVEDDGRGIPETLGERVFEPFVTTQKTQAASGLGLAIVASMLRSHGGQIALTSSTRGACFVLTLPVAKE
jgi:signal transduction histidine kinase